MRPSLQDLSPKEQEKVGIRHHPKFKSSGDMDVSQPSKCGVWVCTDDDAFDNFSIVE